ncbi:MAG: bifunctional methylenetetrahydrofolate dehydrogenase/methenyltetrahydrofolate cyclohydrolase FolD [Eubacteriales bacterium]|nr:bifunctional methylenetetrahydrofolate dehydrogenase/methenyltetrahydrofolate cyclohydrolase FolD [Eubacteriales bacterium]
MAAIKIDGKATAKQIREELKLRVQALRDKGIEPCLAVMLVGEDPASQIYVRNKRRACEDVGIRPVQVFLPADATQQQVVDEVRKLNQDESIHGILVQLPLPRHIDAVQVLDEISPEKDADGFHVINAGKLFSGRPSTLPCTPAGCIELLKRYNVPMSGKNAVVLGRSNIVGKPMAMLLMNENATVTVCHSKTADISAFTRQADIVVSAIGRAGFLTGDMLKPGCAVIDVGINRLEDGRVVGDAEYASCESVAGWITPVPGGVGPMTIAILMRNAVLAAERT